MEISPVEAIAYTSIAAGLVGIVTYSIRKKIKDEKEVVREELVGYAKAYRPEDFLDFLCKYSEIVPMQVMEECRDIVRSSENGDKESTTMFNIIFADYFTKNNNQNK